MIWYARADASSKIGTCAGSSAHFAIWSAGRQMELLRKIHGFTKYIRQGLETAQDSSIREEEQVSAESVGHRTCFPI